MKTRVISSLLLVSSTLAGTSHARSEDVAQGYEGELGRPYRPSADSVLQARHAFREIHQKLLLEETGCVVCGDVGVGSNLSAIEPGQSSRFQEESARQGVEDEDEFEVEVAEPGPKPRSESLPPSNSPSNPPDNHHKLPRPIY
jgi:hypothetical protein